LPCRRWCHSRF